MVDHRTGPSTRWAAQLLEYDRCFDAAEPRAARFRRDQKPEDPEISEGRPRRPVAESLRRSATPPIGSVSTQNCARRPAARTDHQTGEIPFAAAVSPS